jgi:ribosomal protein L25 (general stress protein Ctc)
MQQKEVKYNRNNRNIIKNFQKNKEQKQFTLQVDKKNQSILQ